MSRRLSLLFLFALSLAALTAVLAGTSAGEKRPVKQAAAAPSVRRPLRIKRCPLPARFRPTFERASKQSGIALSMLVAVAQVESSFRPRAISHAGARGLFQLLPSTARELKLDPDDPDANVLAGARYLRRLLDRFSSFDLALAAYNAGPTAVARTGSAPSAETRAYVTEVNRRWQKLAGCT